MTASGQPRESRALVKCGTGALTDKKNDAGHLVIVGTRAAIAAVRLLLLGAAGTVALSIWDRHRHAMVAAVISALRVRAARRCMRYPAQVK